MVWELPEDCVLGIFGQKPEAGPAHSRWRADWGPDVAAEIHDAMLFDTLETWSRESTLAPGGRRVLVYAPADAGQWFDPQVPKVLAMQPQVDGSLADRLEAFFAGEIEDGASRVVVISADSPTLDPSIVVSAFLCLEGRDVVLGPATDGGCYLVGAKGSVPPIFAGIDWYAPGCLWSVLDRLEDTGCSLASLPPWYRVAEPADARMLAAHIRALRRSGLNPGLPRLERLVYGPMRESWPRH
jgi:glycosyltransferase A (GT-A) superfamily protein (DUF2064 family)